MKRFLVIGNPIEHSLSPKIHNYWFKINNIKGIYEKKLLSEVNLIKVVEILQYNIFYKEKFSSADAYAALERS